ncbi:hypothetical protein Tco_0114721, partial [Tanacetum coccineum]
TRKAAVSEKIGKKKTHSPKQPSSTPISKSTSTFATPEKSKGSGEAQEEQISPSTLEAAQILTNVASEGFKGS